MSHLDATRKSELLAYFKANTTMIDPDEPVRRQYRKLVNGRPVTPKGYNPKGTTPCLVHKGTVRELVDSGSLADKLAEARAQFAAQDLRDQQEMRAARDLLKSTYATTPGVTLVGTSMERGEVVFTVKCDMEIDDLFGMRVKTQAARNTLNTLIEEFAGIATFRVTSK
jgi:hypothetical protein